MATSTPSLSEIAGMTGHVMPHDMAAIRADFPYLQQGGKPYIYLDSAASAQKPSQVLDALHALYAKGYANIHRGLYRASSDLTGRYEAVRGKVNSFVNGYGADAVIFTRNTTESINLVASSWGRTNLQRGDEIILTTLEHHANIVPWQMLAQELGLVIKVIPLKADLSLDLGQLPDLLSDKTRLVAFTQISNALGIVSPATVLIGMVRQFNPTIRILVDGSQAVVHGAVDVQRLDADFYVFTGHKLYAPTGSGVLIAKPEILADMPPYQGGGDMIDRVSFAGTTFKDGPARFEAGTPDFMAVIGLGLAIDYVQSIGMPAIEAAEIDLMRYGSAALASIPGLVLYGANAPRIGIFSFNLQGAHHSDVAMILDQQNIAVRNGHHCCQPLMEYLGIDGTVRASCGIYTNIGDINALVAGVQKASKLLGIG